MGLVSHRRDSGVKVNKEIQGGNRRVVPFSVVVVVV